MSRRGGAGRWGRALVAAALCVVAGGGRTASAQEASAALRAALGHEDAGRWREAAVAYRAVVARGGDELVTALLGLERVVAQLGETTTLLPLVDSLVAQRPAEPVLRSVQLRSLRAAGRDDDARLAMRRWAAAAPGSATPWRRPWASSPTASARS